MAIFARNHAHKETHTKRSGGGYSTPRKTATPFMIQDFRSPRTGRDNCVSTASRSPEPYTGEMYVDSTGYGGGVFSGCARVHTTK